MVFSTIVDIMCTTLNDFGRRRRRRRRLTELILWPRSKRSRGQKLFIFKYLTFDIFFPLVPVLLDAWTKTKRFTLIANAWVIQMIETLVPKENVEFLAHSCRVFWSWCSYQHGLLLWRPCLELLPLWGLLNQCTNL